jgi:hypothetical protein
VSKPPVRRMNSLFHEINKETVSSATIGFHHQRPMISRHDGISVIAYLNALRCIEKMIYVN